MVASEYIHWSPKLEVKLGRADYTVEVQQGPDSHACMHVIYCNVSPLLTKSVFKVHTANFLNISTGLLTNLHACLGRSRNTN